MMRYVWPYASLLHCAELLAAHEKGLTYETAKQILPKGQESYGPAVALRWSTHPALGFPRQPFAVWRRPSGWKPDRSALDKPKTLTSGLDELAIAGDELYEIRFAVTPTAGTTLVAEALDAHGRPIPGQRIAFNAAATGAMRCPGICALRLTGTGQIHNLLGMTGSSLANAGDWQRIAVVGLPYDKGSLPPHVYDTDVPQGYEPPAEGGYEAAKVRLEAERGLGLPPPAITDPGVPTPGWPLLDPGALLDQIRLSAGPLEMITKCLDNSVDDDPSKRQNAYLYEHVLEGIRQVDQPLPPGAEPARAGVPVVGVTQLAVGSDSEAATALGYGVIDFPPPGDPKEEGQVVWPPGLKPPPHVYLVEAVFRFPFAGDLTICALSQVRPPPGVAAQLQAATAQRNRPPAVDLPETEAVELSWKLATPPAAYVLAVSRAPGQCDILNAKRVAAPGHDLFVPQRPSGPDGQPSPGARTRFIDPLAEVPQDGTAVHAYYVLARDVFARWATWSKVQHALAAPPVSCPGLQGVKLAAVDPHPPAGASPQVASDLTIEVAWDWSDRACAKIELTGCFFTGATPPAAYLAGLETDAVPGGQAPLVLTFKPDRTPNVPAGATWQAWRISAPGDERALYRVIVHGVTVDYASASERSYAVYARGYEVVRPTSASDVIGPRTCKAADPRPAAPPPLPEILWTALPDAAGRARALLTWSAVPGAAGYFIWEATESALRAAVGMPAIPAPVPGVSSPTLPQRAGAIRDHLDGPPNRHADSLNSFTRMQERALTATRMELDLPGAADGLYVYRISTITASGVESARGNSLAFVGVPRRAVPGEPSLLIRRTAGGVRLYAQAGAGHAPVGFAVHRVVNPRATSEVGMMGPSVYAHDDAGWHDADAGDPALRGQDAGQFKVLDDPRPARWDPYFYRIVAVGPHDPDNGVIAGRSRASALQSIVVPPAAPPILDALAITPPGASRVLTFRTDLPLRTCPLGQAKIAVAQFSTMPGAPQVRTVVLETTADRVPVGPPFAVLAAPTPEELGAMPEVSRGAPDSQGRAVYSVRLPGSVARGAVTVTDPLGRAVELTFAEEA
ncbi:hypothetical protein [Nannocystis sp. SCPEA4]|uniref:hypothetical protein n=1 Tax=Nannocystis sp. SCPEA4 TaxID=2996787 RepID=UPI00226F222F|nr:hypothetical protein [Nannocystis sp. SCPEA4]MCY1054689.1 hypothetical protein [Nannocystis sp. SCPEA4]